MPVRTTSIGWGASGQFPETTTNALSQTSSMSWDAALGVPLSARDPNLLTTSWDLRRFWPPRRPNSAPTRHRRPGREAHAQVVIRAPSTRSSRRPRGTAGAAFWSQTREVDHHERPLEGCGRDAGWRRFGYAASTFDARGRVSARRLPIVPGGPEAGLWRYTYDESNRIRSGELHRPGGSVDRSVAYVYDGLQTSATDPLGQTTVAIANAWGDIVRVTDAANRTTVYDSDAFSQPDSCARRVWQSTGRGHVQRSWHQDRPHRHGSRHLGHRAECSRRDRARARRQDSESRLDHYPHIRSARATRESPGRRGRSHRDVRHGSSATARNIGRLQSTSSSDGSYAESFTYDSVGRLSRRRIVADATYDYDYAYNASGLLATLQYPISTGGYRFKTATSTRTDTSRGSSTRRRHRLASSGVSRPCDAAGRAIDERLGSSIQLLNGFDDTTGLLETRTAGVAGHDDTPGPRVHMGRRRQAHVAPRPQPGRAHRDVRLRRTEPPRSIVAQRRAESRRRLRRRSATSRRSSRKVSGRSPTSTTRRRSTPSLRPVPTRTRTTRTATCRAGTARPRAGTASTCQARSPGRRQQQPVLVWTGSPAMEAGRHVVGRNRDDRLRRRAHGEGRQERRDDVPPLHPVARQRVRAVLAQVTRVHRAPRRTTC